MSKWKLFEFVNLSTELDQDLKTPLQLYGHPGKDNNDEISLWFLAGLKQRGKQDTTMVNLFFRAVERDILVPTADIYVTPVSNPLASSYKDKNSQKVPFIPFPTHSYPEGGTSIEAQTMMRWARDIVPKYIVTFSIGQSLIRHLGVEMPVLEKLSELSERPFFTMNTEPQHKALDGTLIPRDNLEAHFGSWCVENKIAWIDFSIHDSLTSEDALTNEWRTCIGPAIRWLINLENLVEKPQVEQNIFVPEVIPALEMPAEFANL